MTPDHAADCGWGKGGEPCLRFSTDGTRLGADIAHAMGTTDEQQISRMALFEFLSDIDTEQKDWEEGRE